MPDEPVGGAPAPAAAPATPAPAPEPTPTPTPSAPAPSPGATPGADPTPQQRPDMVPSHRLRETRQQARAWAQQQVANERSRLQAQVEERDARIRALAGVAPQEHQDVTQLRKEFAQVFPELAKLNEMEGISDRLTRAEQDRQRLVREVRALRARDSHYWDSHTRTTINNLFSAVEKGIGGELNNDAKRAIHGSFIGYVRTNPQVARAYTTNPQAVVDQYWKTLQSTFIEPVRRAQAAQVQDSATPKPVPQDKPSGAPRATPPPKPKTMQDAVKDSWAAYQTEAGKS